MKKAVKLNQVATHVGESDHWLGFWHTMSFENEEQYVTQDAPIGAVG